MKSKEEIEELVLEKFKHRMYNPFFNVAFVEGYIQCQQDMADKKYTEDDIKEAAYFFVAYKTAKNQDILDKDIYTFIDYLNKQD